MNVRMRLPRLLLSLALLAAAASVAAATETVFSYRDPAAATCAVVGDWNGWDPARGAMERGADGAFARREELADGYHRYRFVVDGTREVDDPATLEWDPSKKGPDNCLRWVGPPEPFRRDLAAYPVLVDLPPAERVVAVGDIHGALPELLATLSSARVAATSEAGIRWTGGAAVLVFLGDYMDRGDFSKECVDLVMELQGKAAAAGGRVVALMGNHEQFRITRFAGYKDPKARESFARAGLDFDREIGPEGAYGRFFRNLPLALRVNGVLFCHGGLGPALGGGPKPFSPEAWARSLGTALEAGRFGCPELGRSDGILWTRDWWDDEVACARALKAWGVSAVAFGHSAEAFGETGRIAARGKRLVKLDLGMTPAYGHSRGGCLEILREGARFVFTALYPDRPAETLFRKVTLPEAAFRALERDARARELQRKAR